MTQKEPIKNDESGEILYQGNKVPFILRCVYGVFLAWSVIYFFLYGFQDLLDWLK